MPDRTQSAFRLGTTALAAAEDNVETDDHDKGGYLFAALRDHVDQAHPSLPDAACGQRGLQDASINAFAIDVQTITRQQSL